MKNLLFILLFLPLIGFGQDLKTVTSCDLIITQLLENTIDFIEYKNSSKPNFRFYLKNQESIINWNDKRFLKWQISNTKQQQ